VRLGPYSVLNHQSLQGYQALEHIFRPVDERTTTVNVQRNKVSQTISRSRLLAVMDLRGRRSHNHITSILTEVTQHSQSLAQVLLLCHGQTVLALAVKIYVSTPSRFILEVI
jgi:hypothetical protein